MFCVGVAAPPVVAAGKGAKPANSSTRPSAEVSISIEGPLATSQLSAACSPRGVAKLSCCSFVVPRREHPKSNLTVKRLCRTCRCTGSKTPGRRAGIHKIHTHSRVWPQPVQYRYGRGETTSPIANFIRAHLVYTLSLPAPRQRSRRIGHNDARGDPPTHLGARRAE